jgi:hypothetical protein
MFSFQNSFCFAVYSRSIGFLGFVAITTMAWTIPDKVVET